MKASFVAGYIALCLLVSVTGCAGQESGLQQTTHEKKKPQVVLQLDRQSAYPFLMCMNKGTGTAEHVRVFEAKTGQEVPALAILQKQADELKMQPAPKDMVLQPGEGAQFQLRSKDAREYTAKWQESGQEFSQGLTLLDPQKIETH